MASSLRTRMLLSFVLLLAVATVASVLIVRQVLHAQLDARIARDLAQETEELRRLATGNDPETGRPFRGDVRRIFQVFLERNVPSQNEILLTLVDGEPFLRSRRVGPYRLDTDRALVARWARLREVEQARVETPGGDVQYLALPLTQGGDVQGVFVAAIFRDLELAEMRPAMVAAAGVGGAALLFGTLLAWWVAEGTLRPVRTVTRTAQAISESDLTRRIEVEGQDEISHLARTFNQMLDRLEGAFAGQRKFLDDAGHELRTPITIVRGHLELLGDDPEERAQTMPLVMGELDRMARMVNDLLMLAKAEQPDFLQLGPVDVEALTHEIFEKASALAPRRWVLERVGSGTVQADRQRVTQAVMQLADNAAKHTSHGDLVGIGSALAEGRLMMWVRDTGPGIPAEHRERIFERFARVREGRGSSDGAGLGLAIVKAIAEAHQGSVDVRSGPAGGSTFTLTLPATVEHGVRG